MPTVDLGELLRHVPHLALRTVVLFLTVLLVMRWTGKRTVTAMAPFDLALVILISEVAAIPITDLAVDLLHGLVPVVLLGALHIGLTRLNLRSRKMEEYTEGKATPVILGGCILLDNLRRERVSLNDLLAALRVQQVTDVSQVLECWLEPTGGVSVILRPEHRPLTLADLQRGGDLDQLLAERVTAAVRAAATPATLATAPVTAPATGPATGEDRPLAEH